MAPPLLFLSGNQVKVLSPDKFIKRIRECLRSVEGAPNEIACHSFRRGSASFCNAIGVSSEFIKLMVDWKSSCYSVYIDNNGNSSPYAGKCMINSTLLSTLGSLDG